MRVFSRFLLMTILCSLNTVAWAAPKLVVDQMDYYFGQVYQGENVRHAFQFSNQGDELLKITKVRSSCGCTAVLASSSELKPGESGEIQADFDSARFHGPVTKTIYLYTNDLRLPVAQLHIKGTVVEMVKVTPKQVNLGTVPGGEPTTAEFTLVNQGQRALALGQPTTTAPELEARLDAGQLEAGQEARVRLKFTPKPGQVRFSGYVTIKAVDSVQPDLQIPVYAMIRQ